MDQGPWTKDQGPRTMDLRPRTKDQKPWTKDQGPMTKDKGPRTMDLGQKTKDQGPTRTKEYRGGAGGPSMGAKSLCIPFEQPESASGEEEETLDGKVCVNPECANEPQFFTLFGRSY